MTKVSNKKNLYVADEDLQWYDLAKELFPDVSLSKMIAESLREKCLQREAELMKVVEHTIFKGKEDLDNQIFIGQEFRFDGILLAQGKEPRDKVDFSVYLTKKGKFLVYRVFILGTTEMMTFDVYETYSELAQKIPSFLLLECASYLNISSATRTYEKLDI